MSQPQRIELPKEQLQQYYKLSAEDQRFEETLQKLSAQLDHELRSRRSKYLTRKELQKLNPSTTVYSSCGKAFIIETVPSMEAKLKSDLGTADKTILTIKKTGIYVQGQQDQIKGQINELIKPYLK